MQLTFGRKRRRKRVRVDGPLRWRQFFGLFLLFTAFAVGIGFLAAQLDREVDEAEASSAAVADASDGTPTPEPTPEGSVAVGGLRLRIAGVDDGFDAIEYDPASGAATRIEVEFTNEAEEPRTVSAFEFGLIDSGGTGYEIAPCSGCPDNLEDPLTIGPGETEQASLYYDLPPGSEPVDLRYRDGESGEEALLPVVAS